VVFHKNNSLPLLIDIIPAPTLVIFGGGLDSQPIVKIAKTLGWYVCLIDSRTAYARAAYFKDADIIFKNDYAEHENNMQIPNADAIVVMHHNILLDAQALTLIQHNANLKGAKYIGLLGPQHRTAKVMSEAQLNSNDLPTPLANPIGLDLGGDLPESIALSILSQAHAAIETSSGNALGYYTSNVTDNFSINNAQSSSQETADSIDNSTQQAIHRAS
jgi:xanthine/CO dehydrogenase XdhC/CoxF family maturation factor